jgi:UDP-N-acetylglucosamine diphosphorylase/glucosamine-1-phosphate N-acetyltransferase
MRTVIFEDTLAENFAPITLTRPTFDLTLGTKTLLQTLTETLGLTRYSLKVRPHLAETTRQKHRIEVNPTRAEEKTTFFNALLSPDKQVIELLSRDEEFAAYSGSHLAAAKLSRRNAEQLLDTPIGDKNLNNITDPKRLRLPESVLIRYPWQLIERNAEEIADQASTFPAGAGPPLDGCSVLGERSALRFEGDAIVDPTVTFDVKEGPILVGEGAEIQSFSRIEGPVYIGRRAQIRSARIGGGTTIGDHCRIGGEVESTIVDRYSNKAHTGFIGHSYVGEWVNIGAGTSNSDIKNTYGTVRMEIEGTRVDTANVKVGCFIADNAKTSIGSFVYTGRRIGVASQIHGYITEDVSSFTVYTKGFSGRNCELRLDSAVETQRRMMARRGVEQTEADRGLLAAVFEMTQYDRYRNGVLKSNVSF